MPLTYPKIFQGSKVLCGMFPPMSQPQIFAPQKDPANAATVWPRKLFWKPGQSRCLFERERDKQQEKPCLNADVL